MMGGIGRILLIRLWLLGERVRHRLAMHHLRKGRAHADRGEALKGGAPLFMHNVVAAAVAGSVFLLARYLRT